MRSNNPKHEPAQDCHICKSKHVYGEHPAPSGICPKCQTKIAVIILVIMVTVTGMVFFGIL